MSSASSSSKLNLSQGIFLLISICSFLNIFVRYAKQRKRVVINFTTLFLIYTRRINMFLCYGNIDMSLHFYFLMLKINPNTTPKNAAKSTW